MIDRLFGMRSGPREALFQTFIRQPRFVKAAAIRTFCALGRKQVERLPTPSRLIFYVTNQCNAKCKHCFFSAHLNTDRGGSLSLEEIERFAVSLKTRLRSLNLTGGEPVLRPDFVDICRVFSETNGTDKITFPTNGLLPDRMASTVREILEGTRLNVNAQVSLDGLRKTHDEMRGVKGAFDRALATVEALRSLTHYRNMNNLSVITTVTRRNYREMEGLIDFVRTELSGVFHKVQFARGSRSDVRSIDPRILSDLDPPDERGQCPPAEALPAIHDLLNRRLRDRDDSLLSKRQRISMEHVLAVLVHDRKMLRCLAGKIDGVVYENGEVALCEMTTPFASLSEHDMDFHRLWHSEAARARRSQIEACYCTHPCNISTSMSYDPGTLLTLTER